MYGGDDNEHEFLKSCYETSLDLARENNLKTIAFPAISCGVYRFPIDEAVQIATATVKEYLERYDVFEKVIFVCFDSEIAEEYNKVLL